MACDHPEQEIRERIAAKAYLLYEKRGWGHGSDVEDWLRAERLVLGELQDQGGHEGDKCNKQATK